MNLWGSERWAHYWFWAGYLIRLSLCVPCGRSPGNLHFDDLPQFRDVNILCIGRWCDYLHYLHHGPNLSSCKMQFTCPWNAPRVEMFVKTQIHPLPSGGFCSLHVHGFYLYHYWFAGSKFLCSALVAPVKNENNDVILFILNLEDITDAPVKSDSYRNSLKNSES